jgi:anti-sigma factor RsiW
MEHDDFGGEGCCAPPGPNGAALMAAVDGEADDETLSHLRACPRCTSLVERLSALQHALRRHLYRNFCPSTDQLVDYCQGLLEPGPRARLTHHILSCPHCAEELNLLERDVIRPRTIQGPEAFFATRPLR